MQNMPQVVELNEGASKNLVDSINWSLFYSFSLGLDFYRYMRADMYLSDSV